MRVKIKNYESTAYDDIAFEKRELVGVVCDFFPTLREDLTRARRGQWVAGTLFLLVGPWADRGIFVRKLRVKELILDTLLGEYVK